MPGSAPGQRPTRRRSCGELVERRLLIETGVPGVYGRGGDFEDVREARRRAGHARGRARSSPSRCAFPRCCRAATSRRSAT